MGQARRDPQGVPGWEQVVGGGGLDLDGALPGVLDLVEVVDVPAGADLLGVVGVGVGAGPDPVGRGRAGLAGLVTRAGGPLEPGWALRARMVVVPDPGE